MESNGETGGGQHRLPDDTSPERYDLTIAPDLDARTFDGSVAITLTVNQATRQLVCNAAEMDIDGAWLELGDRRLDASVELDAETERVTFTFDRDVPAGPAVLHVRYRGEINDKLRGFYASTFTDDDGEHTIGVTQFEATDARRAFPCWDEPAHKAVFGISIDIADDLLCVSNSPELRRDSLGNGRVRVVFADTIPMSTYLVAWVIGPLEVTEAVDVDGVPLRIVHGPGQAHLTDFALEAGAHALRYLADYYGIVYPGDKVDMVAVPDFAFGAMENLGCVIYRETLLLIDPETATQSELMNVADVIAHELAHMWFGDLVTMEWWNGIWLNEAFATFMEMKTTDAFRPTWTRWELFGRERSAAFDTDSLHTTRAIEYPVHSPTDAEGMFDVITYQKGSAVVRMLEQFVGEDAFRDGIRRYLQTHQFGNTETSDLWDAVEAETGVEVRSMMDSWIFQGGYPLIDITADGDTVHVDQGAFSFDDEPSDATWRVPVALRRGDTTTSHLLDESTEVSVAGSGPLVGNAGGHAFYRVRYDEASYRALLDGLDTLEPLERFSVVDDAQGLLLRGDRSVPDSLALVERLVSIGERSLYIWQQALDLVGVIDHVVPTDGEAAWNTWRRGVVGPLWAELGPEADPDDDLLGRTLRGLVLALMADAGDADAMAVATRAFETMVDPDGTVDPGLAPGALTAVARQASAAQYDAMADGFRHGDTVQERLRFLHAMSRVSDEALFDRYLGLLGSDEVRSQDLAFAVRSALRNDDHGPRAWSWCTGAWDDLMDRLPFNSVHRMLEGVTHFDAPDLAKSVVEHLDAHPVERAGTSIEQHLERMWVSVAFRARVADTIVDDIAAGGR